MRECWNEDPASRPSFDDICARLEKLLTELEEKECACNVLRKSVSLCLTTAFPLRFVLPPPPPFPLAARTSTADPTAPSPLLFKSLIFPWSPASRHRDSRRPAPRSAPALRADATALVNAALLMKCEWFGAESKRAVEYVEVLFYSRHDGRFLIPATSEISVIHKSLERLHAASSLVATVFVNPAQPLAKSHISTRHSHGARCRCRSLEPWPRCPAAAAAAGGGGRMRGEGGGCGGRRE
jgi:hypothetical protein